MLRHATLGTLVQRADGKSEAEAKELIGDDVAILLATFW